MNITDLIDNKRCGSSHNEEEITSIVRGFTSGEIPDFQMSAWLMAVCCQGLNKEESFGLTKAMVDSGKTVTFPDPLRPVIDKHSTGGVGDKVSLIVIPMIAACGGRVFKMSGRSLGHTGGTLDKLESIPGLKVSFTIEQAMKIFKRTGAVIFSQSDQLVPADKKIYALRDVTATVRSIPLIASSVISKKIAGGADVFIFDIKFGAGAFLKTYEEAKELASLMHNILKRFGRRAKFMLSAMDEPLGFAIGNRIEVAEALSVLRGEHIPHLNDICVEQAAQALAQFKALAPIAKARKAASQSLANGSALKSFYAIAKAQGADIKSLEKFSLIPATKFKKVVKAGRPGYINGLDALKIGLSCRNIGAGRLMLGNKIDPEASILLSAKVGDKLTEGHTIMTLYGNDKPTLEKAARLAASGISIKTARPKLESRYFEVL